MEWNFASDPNPHIFPPDKNGWRKEKNKQSGVESYNLHWFDGGMVPKNLMTFCILTPKRKTKEEKKKKIWNQLTASKISQNNKYGLLT